MRQQTIKSDKTQTVESDYTRRCLQNTPKDTNDKITENWMSMSQLRKEVKTEHWDGTHTHDQKGGWEKIAQKNSALDFHLEEKDEGEQPLNGNNTYIGHYKTKA